MNEQADLLLFELEDKMEKTIKNLIKEYSTIRTGYANPALLDRIEVEYYSVLTPLKQISSISVVEGNQLYIKPFDKTSLKSIEQSIYASDLGLNPQNDGVGIRLILPKLTEERRKEISKEVHQMGEAQKVAIRNIRRDGNDSVKKLSLPEDNEKLYLDEVQELTDKFVKQIDIEVKIKTEEVMKI